MMQFKRTVKYMHNHVYVVIITFMEAQDGMYVAKNLAMFLLCYEIQSQQWMVEDLDIRQNYSVKLAMKK